MMKTVTAGQVQFKRFINKIQSTILVKEIYPKKNSSRVKRTLFAFEIWWSRRTVKVLQFGNTTVK